MNMVKKTISLTKRASSEPAADMSTAPPDMVKRVSKANFALSRVGLAEINAEVILLLDRSGSMRRDYASGLVQALTERVLAFGLQVDSDGIVPVIPFDSVVLPEIDVTLANYSGVVDREIGTNNMGSTIMSEPLLMVQKMAENSDKPIFLIIIGDGSPDRSDVSATTRAVCELAGYPVFIKFLAIRPVDYLETLDNLETVAPGSRLMDNVDSQFVPDPIGISDLDFFSLMAEEWPSWIEAATAQGLLT